MLTDAQRDVLRRLAAGEELVQPIYLYRVYQWPRGSGPRTTTVRALESREWIDWETTDCSCERRAVLTPAGRAALEEPDGR